MTAHLASNATVVSKRVGSVEACVVGDSSVDVDNDLLNCFFVFLLL